MWDTMNANRERVAELHETYVTGLESARDRLQARLSAPSGPQLDGSVESLDPLNGWFLIRIKERHETETVELPSWWDRAFPGAETGVPGNPFTSMQLALIDEVQAYVGDVMTKSRPDAKWVIYKGHKRDFRNGMTMLQIGKGKPYPVLDLVYKEALGIVVSGRDVPVDTLSAEVRDAIQ
jgi:hypothetical protein